MADKNKREALYHLALLEEGNGNGDLRSALLCRPSGGFEEIWTGSLNRREIKMSTLMFKNEGFGPAVKAISAIDFRALGINNWRFPDGLRDVECSSPVVYFQGDEDLFYCDSVCVKGDYKAEEKIRAEDFRDVDLAWEGYVKEVANSTLKMMKNGYTIVAEVFGDSHNIALNTAMKYGDGKVIGIMKDGLDGWIDSRLKARILEKGLLVSDVPVGVRQLFGKDKRFGSMSRFSDIEMYLGNYGVKWHFVPEPSKKS
jgi:hypothetical protein